MSNCHVFYENQKRNDDNHIMKVPKNRYGLELPDFKAQRTQPK